MERVIEGDNSLGNLIAYTPVQPRNFALECVWDVLVNLLKVKKYQSYRP